MAEALIEGMRNWKGSERGGISMPISFDLHSPVPMASTSSLHLEAFKPLPPPRKYASAGASKAT